MRYTVSSPQLSLFKREQKIEFEALFSEEEIDALKKELDRAYAEKPTGYELQREDLPLTKGMKLTRFGQIASALMKKSPLRLAFIKYHLDYPTSATIDQISSVTEVCGSAILALENNDLELLPQQKGNAIFYDTRHPLPFPIEGAFLLLVFTTDKARYRLNDSDPYTHYLKNLGYGFGDRLTTESHPYIAR